MKTKKITDNRWLQLVVGVIGLLFAGIIYAWSILAAPLAAEFGWSNSQIGLNFTITLSIFCIGGFVSGIISKKTTPMLRMLLAAALIFVSFFISSRLQGSIGVLYIAYGVLGGTAIGLAYNTIIGVVTAWFPDKRGLASGLLLMGFGLNSILIGRIAADMMKNPDIGWRTTYFAIAIVTAAVLAIAAFIIKPPPKDMVFPAPKGGAALRAAGETVRDYSAGEMIRRLSFWKLFIFFILLASVGSASISFAKNIILEIGGSDSVATTMVGVISMANGFGRIVSGWLFDVIGRRKTQFVTSGVAIIAPLVIILALSSGSLAIGVLGMILCGVSYGFAPTGSTAFIGAFFGQKNFSLNLGILNLQLVATAFASTWAGAIKDATGSFVMTFVILTAFSVVGLVLNVFIKKP
ncbi:MAG TPA: OFA family MFS transporter [Papillibacter sp.]|jgi:OFA family oxalate/formate antiporter-like MFS transporter|nr:OFA family MFS transporter [Papillibacter sp.]